MVTTTSNNKELIVIGDVNIDWRRDSSQKDAIKEWAESSDLHQICEEITRYRVVTTQDGNRVESSILDHCYIRNDLNIKPQIIPSHLSDHDIILLNYPTIVKKSEQKEKISLREWRNYKADKFIEKLHSNRSAAYRLTALKEEIIRVMDKEMPYRVVRHKPQKGQFASTKIAKVTKKRDRYIKKFKMYEKKGWPAEEILLKAKFESKRLKRLCKAEERKKIQTKLKSNNTKTFWSTIKGLLGGKNESNKIILKHQGKITEDRKEIADIFVNFFTKKVENLTIGAIADQTYTHQGNDYINITETEIKKAGSKLKNKKCHGPDGIPLRIIKDLAVNAPELLINHLNLIGRMGMPEELKTSRVIPLHKKGDKTDPANFRPISNLSAISKIYEKILLQRLIDETEDMEGTSQHAYRKFHSTTTALLELQHKITTYLDEKKVVACYSMDLSAAFDVLRPGILMNLLINEMQISGGLAFAISDFLSGRKLYIDIEGTKSDLKEMNIGCVQGSILGPRLFTLYMGKLMEAIKGDMVSYADDTYVVVNGDTIEQVQSKIKEISKEHIAFLRSLGMVVNKNKTELLVFGSKFEKYQFDIDGENVESSPTIKALGLTFQHNMKWDKHVTIVTSRVSPKLTLLKKIRKNMTKEQFLKVATAQIFSILYYAAPVWLNKTLTARLWTKLRSVHYRVLRAATRDYKKRKHREELDKNCKRATPKMWSGYITSSTAIKIVRDRYPKYLVESLEKTYYNERRRPNEGKFYDASKGKVGRHKLENRLEMMDGLKWVSTTGPLTNDAIRKLLKEHFNFDFN